MFAWINLSLVTPIFGLALSLPPMAMPNVGVALSPVAVPSSAREVGAPDAIDADEQEDPEEEAYNRQMRTRVDLAKWHRTLGIATWGAMLMTSVLGVIQYYNLYGFGASEGSNPCVQGNAIFGQSQCSGTPWPHALGAGVTAGLYYTTFTLSLLMPDPDDASQGDSEYARTLRTHKLLRWVHFVGMAAQGLLGVVVANGDWFGMDRANDYGTLQALSTVHLGIGLVTLGALTWAGLLML
ncbi:MAG: hypothetical protein H6714_07840 [Myxococcales bacterium]|nr:hypothetical protein [Myxococcales bacterium]